MPLEFVAYPFVQCHDHPRSVRWCCPRRSLHRSCFRPQDTRRCEPKPRRVFGVHLYAQRIRQGIEEEWLLMAATLRDLARWSVKPAKNVDTAKTPRVNVLRGLA